MSEILINLHKDRCRDFSEKVSDALLYTTRVSIGKFQTLSPTGNVVVENTHNCFIKIVAGFLALILIVPFTLLGVAFYLNSSTRFKPVSSYAQNLPNPSISLEKQFLESLKISSSIQHQVCLKNYLALEIDQRVPIIRKVLDEMGKQRSTNDHIRISNLQYIFFQISTDEIMNNYIPHICITFRDAQIFYLSEECALKINKWLVSIFPDLTYQSCWKNWAFFTGEYPEVGALISKYLSERTPLFIVEHWTLFFSVLKWKNDKIAIRALEDDVPHNPLPINFHMLGLGQFIDFQTPHWINVCNHLFDAFKNNLLDPRSSPGGEHNDMRVIGWERILRAQPSSTQESLYKETFAKIGSNKELLCKFLSILGYYPAELVANMSSEQILFFVEGHLEHIRERQASQTLSKKGAAASIYSTWHPNYHLIKFYKETRGNARNVGLLIQAIYQAGLSANMLGWIKELLDNFAQVAKIDAVSEKILTEAIDAVRADQRARVEASSALPSSDGTPFVLGLDV